MVLEMMKSSGIKNDSDKPIMALLPPNAMFQISEALTFGAKKYGQYNYLGGISYTRLISALFRHTFAFLKREDIDPESKLPHTAHMGACIVMLIEMTVVRPEMDDRFKLEVK
jgi:Domain of unknown function (DUF5664)